MVFRLLAGVGCVRTLVACRNRGGSFFVVGFDVVTTDLACSELRCSANLHQALQSKGTNLQNIRSSGSGANAACFLEGVPVSKKRAEYGTPVITGILRGVPLTGFGYFCPHKSTAPQAKQIDRQMTACTAASRHGSNKIPPKTKIFFATLRKGLLMTLRYIVKSRCQEVKKLCQSTQREKSPGSAA